MSASGHTVVMATPASRIFGLAALAILIALVAGPWWLGRADMRLMVELFTYLALAQMWNLLAGYAGLVSVGQQAFLGLGGYVTVIAMAVLASIGTAGVPGVGLVMLTMVLSQGGLPLEGIALILGVDRLMDMIRTAVNISGDAVVTTIVAKTEGQIDMAAYLDPDTGERVDDNLEIDPAVEAELARYAKPH